MCTRDISPKNEPKSQQPPLALFRTSRISSYHQPSSIYPIIQKLRIELVPLSHPKSKWNKDSRKTFPCRLISNHLSRSPSIIFQMPCPAPSPTMIFASIFPPLPGSGRDWDDGSGWKESRILLGEKRGRLNLAEFRYGWVLARAKGVSHSFGCWYRDRSRLGNWV